MSWFDDHKNSTGALSTRLAKMPPKSKGYVDLILLLVFFNLVWDKHMA